jgi:hypothetical protein
MVFAGAGIWGMPDSMSVKRHRGVRMNKLLIGLATVPLMSSAAFAGQALSEKQMDAVTAGFSAFSTSLAESFGGVTAAAAANLAEVSALRNSSGALVTVTFSEVTLNQIKTVSAAQSTSTAANLPAFPSIQFPPVFPPVP